LTALAPQPADSPRVGARLASLFGQPGVITRETTLGEASEPLYNEEASLIAGWADKRRTEFAAARRCARGALAELGITDFPLLPGPDRAPIWPEQVVGSITHTDGVASGYCGVAVASRSLAAGLGIDAEPRQPLPTELWPSILDGEEKRAALESDEPGECARLIFSAKEATYKAVYPTLGRFLDFPDVRIRLLRAQGLFVAELKASVRVIEPAAGPLMGRFLIDHELILTGVLLPRSTSTTAQVGLSPRAVPC
jgi:4'-phosphopantetheinyl transferase EntD